MPGRDELPGTLKRSSEKAQRTWVKAHDSAVETYGEGERAHRVAFAALKRSFEKDGDRWVEKDHKGPSDPPATGRGVRRTYGGVDVEGHTREELYQRARRLGIRGRSRMTKYELAGEIAKKQG